MVVNVSVCVPVAAIAMSLPLALLLPIVVVVTRACACQSERHSSHPTHYYMFIRTLYTFHFTVSNRKIVLCPLLLLLVLWIRFFLSVYVRNHNTHCLSR